MELGEHSYGSASIKWWTNPATTIVGKFCSIGANMTIYLDGNHRMNTFSTYPFREKFSWNECRKNTWGKETPTIGNDVWIGDNVVMFSGVHIGDGAVIGGQSVVAKSVPPYAVVAGNPARIIRYRFDEETIKRFLEYKWWDLPLDVIRSELIPIIDDIPAVLTKLQNIRSMEASIPH